MAVIQVNKGELVSDLTHLDIPDWISLNFLWLGFPSEVIQPQSQIQGKTVRISPWISSFSVSAIGSGSLLKRLLRLLGDTQVGLCPSHMLSQSSWTKKRRVWLPEGKSNSIMMPDFECAFNMSWAKESKEKVLQVCRLQWNYIEGTDLKPASSEAPWLLGT